MTPSFPTLRSSDLFARSFFRLMQWKIASYANIEALSALEAVIESELPPPGTPIEAQSPRIIYLTQRLLAIELPLDPGKAVDIFLELRRLLGEFNAAFPDSKLLDDEAPPMTPAIKRDTILDLFSVAVVPRVKSPAALRNLTLKLAELPDETREYLLSAFSTDDDELRLVMRSEEHTSELQSIMRISYAVFCLKKKTKPYTHNIMLLPTIK